MPAAAADSYLAFNQTDMMPMNLTMTVTSRRAAQRSTRPPQHYRCLGLALLVTLLFAIVTTAGDMYLGWDVADKSAGQAMTNGDMDSPMYMDPFLPAYKRIYTFHPRLKALWLRSLDRPDLQTRRKAINAIAQAHWLGMPGLADTADRLMQIINSPDQFLIARKAAARALIVLDARQSAPVLLQRNLEDDQEMILITDPVLARWDYAPAHEVWMDRLSWFATRRTVALSAVRALQTVRHEPAAKLLVTMATDGNLDAVLRLTAAEAVGVIVSQDLEPTAQKTAAAGSLIDRLVAAKLLAHHRGEAAVTLLMQLALDEEPSVAAIALEGILKIDPLLIKPIGQILLQSPDYNVRRLAAVGVFMQNTAASITALAPLLNDLNPQLRAYVRRRLIEQEKIAKLRRSVRQAAMGILRHDDWRSLPADKLVVRVKNQWRGLEQAAHLLGAVDHPDAAENLVDLLVYPRSETRTAAALALRRLQIKRTLNPILAYAQRISAWKSKPDDIAQRDPHITKGVAKFHSLDEQMAQIMQLFGLMKFQPAEPLMRSYLPKLTYSTPLHPAPGNQARAAAIWALGHLLTGQPDENLASFLSGRLNDMKSLTDPEDLSVRRLSAITIGRMQAKSQLLALQRRYTLEFDNHAIALATRWSIKQITGNQLPTHGPVYLRQTHWFLIPTEKVEDDKMLQARSQTAQ